jgi:lysophospholipase L1-like esterase
MRSRNSRWKGLLLICLAASQLCSCNDSTSAFESSNVATGQKREQFMTENIVGCMVIFGASYAKSWDVQTLGDFRIVNRGVGGDETSGMLSRFQNDVVETRPNVVLIWGFINDVFRAPRANVQEKLGKTRKNFAELIRLSRDAGIVPVLATETTVRNEKSIISDAKQLVGRTLGRRGYHDYVNDHVRQVNDWLRDFSTRENVALLDFESVLSNQSGYRVRKYATDDGSHISSDGYAALTAYVNATLADAMSNAPVLGAAAIDDCVTEDSQSGRRGG